MTELQTINDRLPISEAMAEMTKAIELLTASYDLQDIQTADQRDSGLGYGKRLTKLSNNLETYRKGRLQPFREQIEQINSTIKPVSVLIDTTRNEIKSLVNKYDIEQKRAELAAVAENKPVVKPVVNPKTQLKKRVTITAEIIEADKIPIEYLAPDMGKINKAVKAGVSVPGVKAVRKETLSY